MNPSSPNIPPATRRANVRAAVVLVLVALVFFAGMILTQVSGQTTFGLSALGIAIVGFLVLAIGRNVRR